MAKQGKTLQELAVEIERQADNKKDYIADSRALTVRPLDDGKVVVLDPAGGSGNLGLTNHARRQLSEKLGIPAVYFDRLQEKHPVLLAENVNYLFQNEPARMMVRVLDGQVRGFLSDRYRPLDNFDLADAVLPELSKSGAQIESCEITETRLYIKGLMPWLDRELPMPKGLVMGQGHNIFLRRITGAFSITNSEVGSGALSISPGIFERQCTNLAVFKDEGYGKLHVGKKAEGDDPVSQYLTDGTKKLEDAAVWSRVRDVLKAVLEGRTMDAIVKKLVDARGDEITGNPEKVIEVFAKRQGLSEGERGGLLKHLVGSGEMTRYGLQWAVTRLAQDEGVTYDRASDLERLGGQVIELPKQDWALLAKAA